MHWNILGQYQLIILRDLTYNQDKYIYYAFSLKINNYYVQAWFGLFFINNEVYIISILNITIYHNDHDHDGALDSQYGRWFSPDTSSTTKNGRHNIAEILLKVALNTT